MGRIIANFFISLDGVVESPDQWHFAYFDDEMGAVIGAGMETSAGFLMGRQLYSEWSEFWPNAEDDLEFKDFINNHPKYVVSDSLGSADWSNTTILRGDEAAQRLKDLKAELDGDLTMSGSATTVRWLLANDLLDELHLLLHPIAVGKGHRLFEDSPTYPLRLTKHHGLGSGVLHLVYEPDRNPPAPAFPHADPTT